MKNLWLDADNKQYRNNRVSARSTRTQIDHDVFDGLPVRHWRKASVTVNPSPQRDYTNVKHRGSMGWPELPMPRDAALYSPMSQALLRAARMGQVNKPPPPPLEDEKEPGEDEDAEGDIDTGFVAKRWAVVPRHLEGPEPEFLAKRRKGLPSVYSGVTGVVGGTGQMRKTKVRKIDASGNATVLDVLVPEGQTVEGEIVEEETTSTAALAPGTVVDGVGVANAEGVVIAGDQVLPTPPRRRPPPPKRKPKGPGRGRRKKVGFVSITSTHGTGVKPEDLAPGGGENTLHVTNGQDTKEDVEMREDSVLQDGDEGSEDDDEGEEGDDGDREEGELSPSPSSLSKSPSKPPQQSTPSAELDGDAEAPELDLTTSAPPPPREPSSSPELPLAAAGQGLIAPTIQVEQVEDIVMTLAPSLDQLPTSSAIFVEELSNIGGPDPTVNAELPVEHNPLQGLAEPELPKLKPTESIEQDIHFPDGEEDLLGSLERSLDERDL